MLNNYKHKKSSRHNIPHPYFSSDLYIVEFPKSGITWFTTLLINYDFLISQKPLEASFFNVEQFVSDVHVSKNISSYQLFSAYRCIKSHSEFNSNYRHIIYLVRNPFSVFASYHSFLNGNNQQKISEKEMLRSKKYGPKAWVRHVESWIKNANRKKLMLITYENLRNNTFETFSSVLENLGVKRIDELIELAITNSSQDNMRKSNELFKNMHPSKEYSFVGEGRHTAQLSKSTAQQIFEQTEVTMRKIYTQADFENIVSLNLSQPRTI